MTAARRAAARCRIRTRRSRAGAAGFTLIEMLIVMVLLGLLTALALPAMQRWHDAVQVRAQAAVMLDALRAAAFAAGASRRDIVMDEASFTPDRAIATAAAAATPPSGASAASESDRSPADAGPSAAVAEKPVAERKLAVPLPTGWQVRRVVVATFLSNGLCRPGLVALQTERGEEVTIQVQGPVCAVELAQGAAKT